MATLAISILRFIGIICLTTLLASCSLWKNSEKKQGDAIPSSSQNISETQGGSATEVEMQVNSTVTTTTESSGKLMEISKRP